MSVRRRSRIVFLSAALLGASLAGALVLPQVAIAAQTVSAKVGKPLQEAQAAAKAGDYNTAIAKAKEAQAMPGRTAYEDYVINQFLAYAYNAKRDYRNAMAATEATLSYSGMPRADRAKTLKTLAQQAYQIKDYGKTITYATRYQNEAGADADLQLLVANCYYQQGNYRQSLAGTKALLDSAEASGRAPSQKVLALFLSSAYQLKDGPSIKRALFRLVELYPSDGYWNTLFREINNEGLGAYAQLDLMRIQKKKNLLKTDDDWFNYAKLAFALNLPGDAKAILDEGFQKKILGNAPNNRDQRLQQVVNEAVTKDQAILESDDATYAKGTAGDNDIQVGQRFASYGKYDRAIAAITRGLAKQGVSNPDQAKLDLGRIQLLAGKTDQGRRTLQSIKTDSSTRDVARLFLITG
ncbi:MAG: hypothetical protein WAW96_05010 [Alphaproteobacteria bacterium]